MLHNWVNDMRINDFGKDINIDLICFVYTLKISRLHDMNTTTQMDEGPELDPFLSGPMGNPSKSNANSDFHSRQESADSGLGMGTSSYSLPNTPEDFLSPMDDNMDTISGGYYLHISLFSFVIITSSAFYVD